MSERDIKSRATVPTLELLESRTLYSADVAGAIFGVMAAPEDDRLTHPLPNPREIDQGLSTSDDTPDLVTQPPSAGQALELIFVDAAVRDYKSLVDNITSTAAPGRKFEVHSIEPGVDGIDFVSDTLSVYQQLIDAIHIVSYGSDAVVHLGTVNIDSQSIAYRADQLAAWGAALNLDGDIAFYGCNLASSVAGEALLGTLGDLTGADIAASNDLTGHSSFNGNWDLEYRDGEIEIDTLFSDQSDDDWNALLAVINVSTSADVVDASAADLTSVAGLVSNPGPDGEISLREAVIATEADIGPDEILLGPQTYTLSSGGTGVNGDLDISDDLVIRGESTATTKVDGMGVHRIFDVSSGTVEISQLTLTDGASFDGGEAGAIRVQGGAVTLNNVSLVNNVSTNMIGGAVYVETGATINIVDSIFSGNTADPGGAPNYKDGGRCTFWVTQPLSGSPFKTTRETEAAQSIIMAH